MESYTTIHFPASFEYEDRKSVFIAEAAPVSQESDATEFIASMKKKYSDAQVSYRDGKWMFPMSQSETFGCLPAAPKAQVRVKWANGVIEGKPLYGIRIGESISKEVL